MLNIVKRRRAYSAFAALLLCVSIALSGCGNDKPADSQESTSGIPESVSPAGADIATEPDSAEPISETEPESEPEESTAAPESETAAETADPNKITTVGKYINPLTGLPTEKDLSGRRPAAIMINNEASSLPQEGISQADVIYESLTEGGITRLMMLVSDYSSLDKIGSVRSSRDYYIDFAQNHDAIYVHAGGSTYAYSELQTRGINNLDGVNMYLPNSFFRDAERMKTMRYEHCLMTNGAGIADGIAYKKYRTTLKTGFTNPFSFYSADKQVTPTDGDAKHVIISYTASQFPQFIYNKTSNTYLRYQFNGKAHIDGTTGEQLAFTNLIILVCDHGSYNDSYGRISVDTTGNGKGYYVYGGKYMAIKWSKSTRDSQISFTDAKGNPLTLNCGKTFISVISPSVDSTLQLNYKK